MNKHEVWEKQDELEYIEDKILALKSQRTELFDNYDRYRRMAIEIDELVQQLQKRKVELLGEEV